MKASCACFAFSSLAASIIFFLPIQKVLASSLSFEIDTGNGNILLLLELGTYFLSFLGLAYQVKDIVFRFDYRV
jgi:hypothetical protein